MSDEKSNHKKKRTNKKTDKLKKLIGIDFCACGPENVLKCHGECRAKHTNTATGKVECAELYQVEKINMKKEGFRRPKRDWKFGRQKDVNENKQNKQNRRDKIDRDKS